MTANAVIVRLGRLSYLTCLVIISIAYAAYVVFQKYKLYYFGWALCVLITLGLLLTGSLRLWRPRGALLPLTLFYAYLGLTAFWAYSPARTLYYLASDVLMPTAFMLSIMWAQNTEKEDLGLYFEMMVVTNLLVICYSLLTVGELIDESYYAIRTWYGFVFATAIPFLVWRSSIRRSLVARVLLLICLGMIAVLGNRTGLLAVPVLLVGAFVIVWRVSPRRTLGWFSGFLVACSLATTLTTQLPTVQRSIAAALSRFNAENLSLDISSNVESELSNQQAADIDRRLQAFAALQSFAESPIVGRGYMSTAAKTEDLYGRELSAHGLPFTLLGETGLVGTLLFLWVLGSYFRRLAALRRTAPTREDRGYYGISLWTMIGMLFFGLSQQLHQNPAFFILLAWAYGIRLAQPASPERFDPTPTSALPPLAPSGAG